MTRWTQILLALGLIAALACGDIVPVKGSGDAAPGTTDAAADAAPPPCPERFFERIDGECVPVTVTSFEEIPVEVPAGDDLTLPGILTRPITLGHYVAPAVVFQNGPGPSDADHHVSNELRRSYGFEVPIHAHLAEDLAQSGVVVLRRDARTCFQEDDERCSRSKGDYPGDPNATNADEYVADTALAARWLAARPEVRDRDVTVIGQSYGGVYTPFLVRREEVISGGVLLGAPALSLADTLAGPYEHWADEVEAEQGAGSPEAEQLRAQAAEIRRVLGEIEEGTYSGETFGDRPVSFWENQIAWHARIESTFVEAAAEKPFLLLQGDFDQDRHYEHIEQYGIWAIEAGLEHAVLAYVLPEHGHWLVRILSEQPESRLSPEVARRIIQWMQPPEQPVSPPPCAGR